MLREPTQEDIERIAESFENWAMAISQDLDLCVNQVTSIVEDLPPCMDDRSLEYADQCVKKAYNLMRQEGIEPMMVMPEEDE